MKKSHILTGILTICTIALILSGCGSSSSSSTSSGKKDPQTGETYPKTMKIGLMEGGPESAILAKEGYLKHLGVKVKTTTYSSGTSINNAIVSKDLDAASFGVSPFALGVSNGVSYKAVGISYVESGNIEALVSKKSITSLKQLKGKTIGVTFGTTSQYALVKTLKKAGIKTSQVTFKDLSGQNIVADWKRGDIDAAYTWSPALNTIEKTGNVLSTDGQLKNQGVEIPEVSVVDTSFAKKYPTLVKKYDQAMLKVYQLVKNNPKQAIKDVASWEGISESQAKSQITENDWLSGKEQASYLSSGKLGSILKTVEVFNKQQKNISSVPSSSTLSDAIDASYIKKALK
ncbi:taurine ABC transporter substrate-binding protein [Secundilactobacillus paracollinoides]|uniref:taurine ABC transporter substrate-binding protein n=1 Tax=Secundilactobacillus paracollinoides TaxID=240427 RepID=UPI0006D0BDD5|nr:ABC transporter substrate-binding protein [Secundilactobacillus paracollinoides]KRL77490.1 taurine-binding periplasmic protein [Secundilactobacillus paracollinoides DSM 15502 = JCM 11969]